MRRPLKWLAWGGAALAVMLVVLVIGIWGAMATEAGRRFLADRIEQAASDGTLSLRIGRLAGALPGQVDLEEVTFTDRNGAIARIDLLSVSWHPLALLSKRLHVERIALSGVAIERLPVEPEAQPARSGGMPSLATGFEIDIAAISANEIALGPAIAGSTARLSATGSIAVSGDASRARIGLDVRRIDGAEGRASLALDYAAEPARFAARVEVEEPSGGPIAALAGLTGEFPLTLRLDGAGPPEAWRGRLVGTAGPSTVGLDLFVGVAARVFSVRVDGTVQAGPLLPATLASVLGTSAQVSTALSFGPEAGWRVERARLAGERLVLSGSGSYLPVTGSVAGEILAETLPAAGPLRLPGLDLATARVAGRISGTASRPTARLDVSGAGIATSVARLAAVEGGFDLAPESDGRLSVKGDVRLGGILLDDPIPPGLLGSDATMSVDGSWLPGGGFTIGRLALTSDGLAVTANGRSEDGVRLAGSYEVAKPGIGGLAGAAASGGDLRLGGGYRFDLARLAGEVELVGDLGNLRGSGALLGPSVALTGAVARAEDGRIDVIGLEIGGVGGSLRASASLDPAGGVTAGHIAARLPDLSRVAETAGLPLSGRASLEADLSGPWDALAGTGRLRLDQVTVGSVALDQIAVGIGFKAEGTGVSGAIQATLAKEVTRLPGSLRFALDRTRLRLADILFAGDGNRLSGDLQVALPSGLTSGTLDARIADIASLGLVAPGQASGALTLGAKLDAGAGQRVTLSGTGTALRIAGTTEAETVTIGGLTLAATIEDAVGARRIAGKIDARDMTARDQAAVSRAALEVSTDRDGALRFDVAVDGRYGDPLSLRLAGTSRADGEGLTIELTRLSGSAAGVKIESTAPGRIVARDAKTWSGALALRVGGGDVTATASVEPAAVAASIVVAGMPVAALAAATRHLDPGATWSARLDLSGTPANPRGTLSVSAKGMRPVGASWSAADALALVLDGTLADGRVALAGKIVGPDSAEVTATASLPLNLSLAPVMALEVPDGPVSGTAALRGRLEMVEALVDIGENWLSGAASASITLAGTTRAPDIRGAAQVSGGRFEGVQSGVVISEIEAGLEFDGSRLRIARLSASDAGQGRLAGSGEVRFDGGWPLDLALTSTRFAAISRDDATLSASGEVRILGNVSAPRIEGRLTVDGGEIRIPDRIGTSAVSLDVVEINRPGGTPSAAKASRSDGPAPMNGAAGIALDVTVAAPGRVFVRGRGLDSEWSGDLKIGGTTAQPVIVGVLSVVRGSFALAGRSLAVNQGNVTFRAGQLDPEIDTRATLSLSGSEITVQVSGRASAPTISLSSVPSKPTEEILALMLFGKSAGALTAFQAAQLARSAAALSGNFSGDSILDRARRGLGVDALTVESQGETTRGTALKAGKYVADGVFVTMQQGASAESQKVGVEIEVTPSITVETGVGPSAGNTIGLNWKLDY